MSNLETEATTPDGMTTFEHLGSTWTVPIRRHHSHIRRLKQIIHDEGGVDADDIAAVYLSPEEYDVLVALDLDEPELGKFADAIAKAMGVVDKGNSSPST